MRWYYGSHRLIDAISNMDCVDRKSRVHYTWLRLQSTRQAFGGTRPFARESGLGREPCVYSPSVLAFATLSGYEDMSLPRLQRNWGPTIQCLCFVRKSRRQLQSRARSGFPIRTVNGPYRPALPHRNPTRHFEKGLLVPCKNGVSEVLLMKMRTVGPLLSIAFTSPVFPEDLFRGSL